MLNNYKTKTLTILLLTILSAPVCAQEESMDTIIDPNHLLAYLTGALLITLFVMVFYNRVFYYRERDITKASKNLNEQLSLVLESNNTKVWTYTRDTRLYKIISTNNGNDEVMMPLDFSLSFDRDDFHRLREMIFSIIDGLEHHDPIIVKGCEPKEEGERRHIYEISVSILHRDSLGKPYVLLGTQHDITDSEERAEQKRKLMLRYQTVFNSSLVDMLYYDADGILTDLNEKACETFHVSDREALLKRHVHFNDIPAYRSIDYKAIDTLECSTLTDIDKVKLEDERIPELKVHGKMYYETTVGAVHDDQGNTVGVVTAGRDVTDMVESYRHQKESTQLMERATKEIQQYVSNINYSLRVSDVRLMNYDPDTHMLKISNNLNNTGYELTQMRAITLIRESDRRKTRGLLRRMDSRRPGAISCILHTIMRDKEGRDVYLEFNVMPITDKDGRITHYFGMCRNETERIYTDLKLQTETAKAQDTERLKDLFLFNMSYELRTPLNAVIGFAQLFNSDHSPEDEPIFAEQIKKNTNDLLKLVDDILFMSRLDSHMIEYNYEDCDFATLFDGWCYMGWSEVNPNVKTIVENPYDELVANIDMQYTAMIIQKLCSFSAVFTSEGTIRAKYEYRHGELMITIEDTGRGIAPDDVHKSFERFSRDENNETLGGGLDMPIIHELAAQMGGTIELQSEKGKGTTAFFSLPCETKSIRKKSEII